MIDAYTIGITLALDDGVSEGLAAIRRDLALLDASVDKSLIRLQTLRNLASRIIPASDRDRSLGQAAVSPLTPSRPPEEGMPSEADNASIPQTPMPMPAVPHAPVSPGVVPAIAPIAPGLPPTAIAPIVTGPPLASAMQSVPSPALPSQPVVPTPVPTLAVKRDRAAAPVTAPAPIAALPVIERPVDFNRIGSAALGPVKAAAIASPAAPADLPAQMPHSATEAAAPRQPPISMPTAPLPAKSTFTASVPIVAMTQAVQAPQRAPVSPVATLQAPPAAANTPSSGSSQAASPPVASSPSDAPGSVYAEIHLDGTALGRWVTRHLEKQVLRPQAGATGFDPRMTPSWPGAPIGN